MHWLWQAGRSAARSSGADRAAAALRGLASAAHGADADTGAGADAPAERTSGQTRRNNRLRYFVVSNNPAAGLELLEASVLRRPFGGGGGSMLRMLQLPPPAVCSKLLHQAAQSRQHVEKAASLARALALQGVALEQRTLLALATGLAQLGQVEPAMPLLDLALSGSGSSPAPGGEHPTAGLPRGQLLPLLTLLMDSAARAGDTVAVTRVLSHMAGTGLMPSTPSMTSLLQCFMRMGRGHVAHEVLGWMRAHGLQPSVYTYTALLALPTWQSHAESRRALDQARKIYEHMRADGVTPNAHFYAAYLSACSRAGALGEAERAWQDMLQGGVARDLITYSAMIGACAKCRAPARGLALYRGMRAAGIRPDVVAATSALAALRGSPGAAPDARAVWADMRAAGVAPNGLAVAALLGVLLDEGELDEALGLLASLPDEAGASPAGGGACDVPRLYENLMLALAQRRQLGLVRQLALHAKSRALLPTPGMAAALLTAAALESGHSRAPWLLAPDDGRRRAPGPQPPHPAAAWPGWQPGAAEQACLLGAADPLACVPGLEGRGPAAGRAGPAAVLVALGSLAAHGRADEATRLADWAAAAGWGRHERYHRWTQRLLLFSALNGPGDARAAARVSRALGGPRRDQGGGGGDEGPWDARTRREVAAALRAHAPATAARDK